jgi:hypothetical protein
VKQLAKKPSVPPYLHLGSVWLALPASTARSSAGFADIETEWRKICRQIIVRPKLLHTIIKRMDQRDADPDFTDDPHEIYYTVTDGGRERSSVNFYM